MAALYQQHFDIMSYLCLIRLGDENHIKTIIVIETSIE